MPGQAILVINAGSSSLKFSVFSDNSRPGLHCRGEAENLAETPVLRLWAEDGTSAERALPAPGHGAALTAILRWLDDRPGGLPLGCAGHRVVHGGMKFRAPIAVTPEAIRELERLVPLAPLHQPHNVLAIRTLAALHPGLKQIACFDTAFHRAQPPFAQWFGLPRALTEEGVIRYGFHGLSYEYIAQTLPDHIGAKADGRVVVAHLGNGASMCAMRGRESVASTMGFTPLDGLLMGTRPGALDPGAVLYLMQEKGMTAQAVSDLLYRQSGLLGVSGVSHDMRALEESADPRAAEAVEFFCYRAARELGSLAAALGGLDALVFTGGIGEHSARVRERICAHAAWLGIDADPAANMRHGPRISRSGSRVDVLAIPTDEAFMIARHCLRVL